MKIIVPDITECVQLAVKINGFDGIENEIDDLLICCRGITIESMEFYIKYRRTKVFNALMKFNKQHPIHKLNLDFEDLYFLGNSITFFQQMNNLTHLRLMLQTDRDPLDELFKIFSVDMRYLKELEIYLYGGHTLNLQTVLMHFVQNSLKLRKLTFTNCHPSTFKLSRSQDEWISLNATRLALIDASRMTIEFYFRKFYYFVPTFLEPRIRVVDYKFIIPNDVFIDKRQTTTKDFVAVLKV